jgi:hypothetical protein
MTFKVETAFMSYESTNQNRRYLNLWIPSLRPLGVTSVSFASISSLKELHLNIIYLPFCTRSCFSASALSSLTTSFSWR